MAESNTSSVKEFNAKAQIKLLHKYVASLEKLSSIINNPSDSASEDGAKKDGTGQIISHLQELGDEIKKYLTDETQITESWRNLWQKMDLGLNLVNMLLEKNKPNSVQELGGTMSCMCSFEVCFSHNDKKKLTQHKDEMDGIMKNIRRPISKDFYQKNKWDLETRLPILGPILNELEKMEVLNSAERQEIQSKSTDAKKNESLLKILDRKGAEAQEKFCKILQRQDPYLVKDLDEHC